MNAKQLNASALFNSAKEMIGLLANSKKTIKAVVTEWNVCVEQSGLTGVFDFPVDGYTRKAQVVADLERCMIQLNNIKEGREALESAPVEAKHETMVQDIKKGMVVVNPVMQSQRETVLAVDDFSCYFIITFSGIMGQQYFDRGETLIVCEQVTVEASPQITNVIPKQSEALNMTISKSVFVNSVKTALEYVGFNYRTDGVNHTPAIVDSLANIIPAASLAEFIRALVYGYQGEEIANNFFIHYGWCFNAYSAASTFIGTPLEQRDNYLSYLALDAGQWEIFNDAVNSMQGHTAEMLANGVPFTPESL